MKRLAILALLVSASALAGDLSPEQQAACNSEGGCIVITRGALKAALMNAFQAGLKEGAARARREV